MRVRDIIHCDLFHALCRKHRGEPLRCAFHIAVHRCINYEHPVLLRFISAPLVVLFDEISQILTPKRPVKRAYDFYVDAPRLLQQSLHVRPVFPDYIRIVSSGVIYPVSVKIRLITEKYPVQRSERPKSICRKQDSICRIKRYHGFGPVHHRRLYERDRMFSEADDITF